MPHYNTTDYLSYYLPPVVQFTSVDDFIADLDRGHTLAVYHALEDSPHGYRYTIVRAIVINEGHTHVAALAFKTALLFIVDEYGASHPARGDALRRHEEDLHRRIVDHIRGRLDAIGVLDFRPGIVSIPHVLDIRYIDLPAYD